MTEDVRMQAAHSLPATAARSSLRVLSGSRRVLADDGDTHGPCDPSWRRTSCSITPTVGAIVRIPVADFVRGAGPGYPAPTAEGARSLEWDLRPRNNRAAGRLPQVVTTTNARDAASALFEQIRSGAPAHELAQRYHEDVDWFIPGDTSVVPWVGRKIGRTGVAEFYTQLAQMTKIDHFTVDTIVGEGPRCVALGSLRTQVLRTGRDIVSDFAFDIEVRDGLITRYHMFEDTWAVADAFNPKTD